MPIQSGREFFLAQRNSVTQQHISLLLQNDQPRQAAELIRRSRIRALRSLEQDAGLLKLTPHERAAIDDTLTLYTNKRNELMASYSGDWQRLSTELVQTESMRQRKNEELDQLLDQLFIKPVTQTDDVTIETDHSFTNKSIAQDELILMYYELSDRWIGIAQSATQISVQNLSCVSPQLSDEALGNCILAPFENLISDTSLVRLMPTGVLSSMDLHAAHLHGRPLIASVPTVYDLDISKSASQINRPTMRSVLIADPNGNLSQARQEVSQIAETLNEQNIPTETLVGQNATSSRTLQSIAESELVHFAGHAEFGGVGGWDSRLQLASNTFIGVGDVLAMPQHPSVVVLSGCETGKTNITEAQSIGLAQAFLVGGTEAVIATTKPVDDGLARTMTNTFYRYWLDGASLAKAFQLSVMEIKSDESKSGWSNFRLIVR